MYVQTNSTANRIQTKLKTCYWNTGNMVLVISESFQHFVLIYFCSKLVLQKAPFFFTVWYHILQGLSLFGWSGMIMSLILLTSKKLDTSIPNSWRYHKQLAVSALCIISGWYKQKFQASDNQYNSDHHTVSVELHYLICTCILYNVCCVQ